MGYLLSFDTASGHAECVSQADIGNATALGFKARVTGAWLRGIAAGQTPVEIGDGASTNTAKLLLKFFNSGSSIYCEFDWRATGWLVRCSMTVLDSLFAADQLYWIYTHFDKAVGSAYAAFIADDGTVLGSDTQVVGGSDDLYNASAAGRVSVGAGMASSFGGSVYQLDGLAIYSGALDVADRYTPGSASDAGILACWPMDEGSGLTAANTVSGGEALALDASGVSWVEGGTWDGAGGSADAYTGTLAADAQTASAEVAGAYTAPSYSGALEGESQAAAADLAGTYTAPIYTGALAGESQAATASLAGAYTVPTYAGALAAESQSATAALTGEYYAPGIRGALSANPGASDASLGGAYTAPTYSGALAATAQDATTDLTSDYAAQEYAGALSAASDAAAADLGGSYTSPAYLGTLAVEAGLCTVAFAGAYAVPVYVGDLTAAARAASALLREVLPVPPYSATLTVQARTPALSVTSRSPALSVASRTPALSVEDS